MAVTGNACPHASLSTFPRTATNRVYPRSARCALVSLVPANTNALRCHGAHKSGIDGGFFVAVYADALVGTGRRIGFAPGRGNCICQKFVSDERNSTPRYCLLSRARWMETTRHSIDCEV